MKDVNRIYIEQQAGQNGKSRIYVQEEIKKNIARRSLSCAASRIDSGTSTAELRLVMNAASITMVLYA